MAGRHLGFFECSLSATPRADYDRSDDRPEIAAATKVKAPCLCHDARPRFGTHDPPTQVARLKSVLCRRRALSRIYGPALALGQLPPGSPDGFQASMWRKGRALAAHALSRADEQGLSKGLALAAAASECKAAVAVLLLLGDGPAAISVEPGSGVSAPCAGPTVGHSFPIDLTSVVD